MQPASTAPALVIDRLVQPRPALAADPGFRIYLAANEDHGLLRLDRLFRIDADAGEDRHPLLRLAPASMEEPSHRHSGFTLLELLVAVSIIAVLIALLLPAMKNAKAAAVTTQCLSNQRQVIIASFAAATDHKGVFIPTRLVAAPHYWPVQTSLWTSDRDLYESYGLTDQSWTCPGRRFRPEVIGPYFTHTYQYFPGSKSWQNYHGIMPSRSPSNLDNANADRAMMADSTLANNGVWGDPTQPVAEDLPVHGRAGSGEPLGANHIFGDGSGQWVPFEKMDILTSWWLPYRTLYFHQKDVPVEFAD